jgi:hypothetical protein
MRSSAPKQAESEFDDLLGQLVDELAMTPASESAVALVPDPPPAAEVHVDSTQQLAAEAAAAAQARAQPAPSTNNLVKIVGIIAGSLTVVAVAALVIFGNKSVEAAEEGSTVAADQADGEDLAERARAEQAAVEQAQVERIALEQAEANARKLRIEAELLSEKAKASAVEAEAPKPKARPRKKPKAKPQPKPGDSFEDL